MTHGRIRYFCPDFPQPSGGVRTLYRHVSLLVEAGLDAAIVHQKRGFRADWHACPAPVIWLEDRPRFEPDDTLVFPEVMADHVRQTTEFRGRRIVFALSWSPAYNRLKPGERWTDLGIDVVMTQSRTVQRLLEWSMELPVVYVPPYIDPALYFTPPYAKTRNVAYMTRKDRSGEWLQGTLTRRNIARGYSWTPLRNLDEAAYAAALRSAMVYVPTTTQEGLHVSVLEAMACGCLVVGFSGIGGTDYLVPSGAGQNSILVENGDLYTLGVALEGVLAGLAADVTSYGAVVADARAIGSRYHDPTVQRDALVAFLTASMR